jgi:hypothetical protein
MNQYSLVSVILAERTAFHLFLDAKADQSVRTWRLPRLPGDIEADPQAARNGEETMPKRAARRPGFPKTLY